MSSTHSGGSVSPTTNSNNFGFLRLLFASLVIVAHSPQILDGSLVREPFTRVFGTITLGAFAVDFFFIISGFLIVGSFISSRDTVSFLLKRVLRIYPAFIVAYLLCLLLVGPLWGGSFSSWGPGDFIKSIVRMLTLDIPELPGAVASMHEQQLNGSMWTISYEFRCYLLVPLLGLLGVLRRPRLMLALTAALLAALFGIVQFGLKLDWGPLEALPSSAAILRDPEPMIRLAALFLSGACFRLYFDRIRFDGRIAAVCAVAATLLMFIPSLAEVGLATFGAYAIFWVAFTRRLPFLKHINNDWDISYGVYLYAWPIASSLAMVYPQISPTELSVATWLVACGLGFLSWKVLEKPCLELKQRRSAAAWDAQPAANAGPSRSAQRVPLASTAADDPS